MPENNEDHGMWLIAETFKDVAALVLATIAIVWLWHRAGRQ